MGISVPLRIAAGIAAIGSVLLLVTGSAHSQSQPAPPPQPSPQQEPPPLATPPEYWPEYAIPTTNDRAGRVVVAAYVQDQGPYRFIIDTGANRSAVSQRLAQALSLQAGGATGNAVVHGITGSAVMPLVEIGEMRVGTFKLGRQRVAVLPDAVFGSADGILGIDVLQKARIDIDFDRDQVVVRASSISYNEGRLVVHAKLRGGGLMLVPARVGKVKVVAIVDTGAERTLGNEALRQALALQARKDIDGTPTTVIGATAQTDEGLAYTAPIIWIGSARVKDFVVTFGDFHVFDVWSLRDKPALVIGMDVFGWLPQVTIDYPRRELQLRLPDARLPRTTN